MERKNRQSETARRKQSSLAKIEYSIVGFGVFLVLIFIISNYVELSKLTSEIYSKKTQLETLEGEYKSLEAKQEKLFNLSEIEKKEKNELGMVKLDQSQIQYIELTSPEKLKTAEDDETVPKIVEQAISKLNIIVEYLN